MPNYGASGEKNGGIGYENSRKPVFGFRLLGEKRERGILQRSQRVYLDETGFDRYLFRPYARSLKGQIVKAQISGKRYQRLSPVSAQVGNRLIAPMVYQNTMTGVFFEAWFQQCLLPALTQKSVIILDNARFHRMGVLREMAEKLGHKVLPLAPYSPEPNPIEKVWANIKRYLRTVLSDYARFDDALLSYSDFN